MTRKGTANRAALQSGGILLFRRKADLEVLLGHPGGPFWSRRDDGAWSVPKGLVEAGEDLLAAARRELREETGLEIEPTEFLGLWMQAYDERSVLSLTWLARPAGGEERAGDDLTELRWFSPDELPGPEELAFETYVEILSLWRARQQQP
jgi:ADP-ribose pyrophosphatase YjhB (NUDIX family)